MERFHVPNANQILALTGHIIVSQYVQRVGCYPVHGKPFVLEQSDEGGYTVYVPSLPGCISEGDTKEEAFANIKEAIGLYMEPVEDDFTVSPDTEIMEIAV